MKLINPINPLKKLKPLKLSIYILLSISLLFTLTCDIYDKSVPDYLDTYTNKATVAEHSITGGLLTNQQGVPYQNLIGTDSVITLKLRNPKNYEVLTTLEYHNGSSWERFEYVSNDPYGDYSNVVNMSLNYPGTTFTVKYDPTTQIRITINNAEIGRAYKLKIRLNDKETKREFDPYEMPAIKCTGHPTPVGLMMVRAGDGNTGVVVDWQHLLRSGTTMGDHADANRLVISCSDLGVSQTYTRVLNEGTSLWGPWSPAGINETSNPFFSITLGAGTTLIEGRSYNVVLRFSNEAGVVTEISESLTAATMDARITRGGVPNEYPSLQEAFDSMDTHGETSATITVLRSIIDQAPITITGSKTITLESSGSTIVQLGSSHVGSSLFTVHSGLSLKIGGAGGLTLRGIDNNTVPLISVNTGGILTLDTGAVITGNKNNNGPGGGVDVAGTFNMLGGTIQGNSAYSNGGGVFVSAAGSSFAMSNGTITGNEANNGAGVYVSTNAEMTLSNGTIAANTAASNGGGVYLNGTFFDFISGSIERNNAVNGGGGVYVQSGSFAMSSGSITGNNAAGGLGQGGGVNLAGGTFNLSGSSIIGGTTAQTRNTAVSGGGVYSATGTFNFSNGTIIGNTASGLGGGVFLSSGTFNMTGGSVEGNTATSNGGGVHINLGNLTMSGGVIYGTDASPSSLANRATTGSGESLNVAGGSAVYGGTYGSGNILPGSGLGSFADTIPPYEATVTISGVSTHYPDLLDAFNSVQNGQTATITLRKNVTNFKYDITGTGKAITLVSDGAKEIALGTAVGSMFTVPNTAIFVLGTSGGPLTLAGGLNNVALITVNAGGTLTLNSNAKITGNDNTGASAGDGIGGAINSLGNLNINGGTITGNTAESGGGVYFAGTTFTMSNGSIEGNFAIDGAGVYMQNGNFNMNGGAIGGSTLPARNTASQRGAGVFINTSAAMTMNNTAVITGNRAANGGGVYYYGSFNMGGGEIYENTATANGGGVYINGATMTMGGGGISDNTATANGGGVFIYDGKGFTMNNGGMYSNSADYGAGVYIGEGGSFTKNDGSMGGNTATSKGGGVYMGDAAYFSKTGGDMEENTAPNGAGVYVGFNSLFIISGGSLNSNTATVNGGGVYVESDGSFTMSNAGRITVSTNNNNVGNNDVYLESEAVVGIGTTGIAASPTGKVARITPATYSEAPPVQVLGGTPTNISNSSARFDVTPYMGDSWFVNSTGNLYQPAIELVVNAGTPTYPATLQEAFDNVGTGATATIKILKDIASQPTVSITGAKTVTLTNDASPREITLATTGNALFSTNSSGAKLILQGNSLENTLTLRGRAGNTRPVVLVDYNGILELDNDVIITGNTASNEDYGAGGVCVYDGTFTMRGGTITGNTSTFYGGGVHLVDGTFNMSGGTIKGNTGTDLGGGVYVAFGTFNMSGGTIEGNNSGSGGGVHVAVGAFIMTGGTVYGNEATHGTLRNTSTTADRASLSIQSGTGRAEYAAPLVVGANVPIVPVLPANRGADFTLPEQVAQVTGSTGPVSVYPSLQAAISSTGTPNGAVGTPTQITVLKNITTAANTGFTIPTNKHIQLVAPTTGTGVTITAGPGSYYLFTVNPNSSLTLSSDSSPNSLTLSGTGVAAADRRAVWSEGTFTMRQKATISGFYNDSNNSAENRGAGVYIDTGNFNMLGGDIENNVTTYGLGGGVYFNGTTFTMSGGTIGTNSAVQGGGIYFRGTTFNLSNGAVIYGNDADFGAGVYMAGGTFTMSAGLIEGNEVRTGGTCGGVYIQGGTFTMSNTAVIRDNNGSFCGGGVFIVAGTFNMNGGTIEDNIADQGAGVCLSSENPTFTMSNGTIAGNEATFGGGVLVFSGTFTMSGGTIGGTTTAARNTADSNGGGVYINRGLFEMTGGIIAGNEALRGGGGVFMADSEAVFNMTNGSIENNEAKGTTNGGGGGVKITAGTFNMSSPATIKNNRAVNALNTGGAGVFLTGASSKFEMNSGIIEGNIATFGASGGGGGGVAVFDGANFIMNNGTIGGTPATQNSASNGGGVYIGGTGSTFTMNNGFIQGNTVSGNGGGVYSEGTFTMNGGTIYGLNEAVTALRNLTQTNAPATGPSLYAASGTAKYGPAFGSGNILASIPGGTDATLPNLDFEAMIGAAGYMSLQDAFTAAVNGSTIKVIKNITSAPVTIVSSAKTINLVSDGDKTITLTGTGNLLAIPNNVTLRIGDSSGEIGGAVSGELTLVGVFTNTTPLINVSSTATLEIYDNAIITGNFNTAGFISGGILSNGTLRMYGGIIQNNRGTGSGGGGVYIAGGLFDMYGGIIQGNTTTGDGGGVSLEDGTFTMYGGTILGNELEHGSLGNSAGSGSSSLYNNAGIAKYGPELGGGNIISTGTGMIDVTLPAIEAKVESTGIYYDTLASALTAAPAGAYGSPTKITILKNITKTGSGYTIPGSKHIQLVAAVNGIEITAGAGGFPLFTTSSSSSLTLGDGGNTIALWGGNQPAATGRCGVYVSTSSTFVMNSGATIKDFKSSTQGGGLYVVNGATFDMRGGTIQGNSASYGGGVFVYGNGEIIMTGGTITGNSTTNMYGSGGGVFLDSDGVFTMSGTGSVISYNTSLYDGGGVYVLQQGRFVMNNGTIENNTASVGAGVLLTDGGTMEMNNGTVRNNTATNDGGGICVGDNGHLDMNGGTIQNNTAAYGGGVYVADNGYLTMEGGARVTVSGNNDIYLDQGSFDISANFTGSDTVARITPSNYATTRRVLGGTFVSTSNTRFIVTPDGGQEWTIDSSGYLETATFSGPLQALINAAPAGGSVPISTGGTLDGTLTVSKHVKITTPAGSGNTTLLMPGGTFTAFTVNSGGILEFQPAAGTTLTIDGGGLNSGGFPLIRVNAGGEMILNDNMVITNVGENSNSAIIVSGGTFTMKGGTISNSQRQGPIHIQSGGTFTMDGGRITGNNANNNTLGSIVRLEGTNTIFVMNDGEIDSNQGPSTGGAVRVSSGARFNMLGGTIRNNVAGNFGGGVYVVEGGTFIKTAGIIYGLDDGTPNWNRITNAPSPANRYEGQGYAVYCEDGHKVRDDTSESLLGMNSNIAGVPGGWKAPITTGGPVTISGTPAVGQPLTAVHSPVDGTTGTVMYLWMQGGIFIRQLSDSDTFTPSLSGSLTVSVFRTSNSGSFTSAAVNVTP